MAIDPTLWANTPGLGRAPLLPLDWVPTRWADTPGLGRAPLLPDPLRPATATTDPRMDLVRRLMTATGNDRVMPGDRPVGALVRDPSRMTIDEMVMESRALEGPQRFAPNVAGAIAAGGTLGLGTLAGIGGRMGIQERQERLGPAIEQRLGGILATGQPTPVSMQRQRDTQPATIARADPYEAGRQIAQAVVQRQNESRSGADQRSRSSQAAPGFSRSDDPDVGWGGA